MAISTARLVYVLFLSAMIILNLAGNSLVCFLILKKKATRTSINWLLFHLAVADLLVAVFFIPPCIMSHFIEQPASGLTGDLLCKFVFSGVLGWVAAAASSSLLVVIAFERYHATLYPFKKLGGGRSLWLVPVVWIIAILLLLPNLVVMTYDEKGQKCIENFPDYATARAYKLTWSFCNSVLPIFIMGYLYVRIILCLRNRVSVPGSCPNTVLQSRIRVTKMLLSVSVIFIACWTPPAVLCALSPVVPGGYVTVYYVTKASALLNSCLDPVVYTLLSQQFRKSLSSLVCCSKTK